MEGCDAPGVDVMFAATPMSATGSVYTLVFVVLWEGVVVDLRGGVPTVVPSAVTTDTAMDISVVGALTV